MKNYLSKIENFDFQDYISRFRQKNPFAAIISIIAIFFLLILYFTIPAFYSYKNYDKEIQRKVSEDFKLNLKNISGITYLILPSPHFLIEECDIYFSNNSEEKILNAKHLKINVFLKNLHQKDKIELKSINLNKVDLDLQFLDLKNFFNHLKNDNPKPIYINNSNIFFRDQNEEIISISKIKKFEYFFDNQNQSKKLNILGNLFGSNFKLNWINNLSDSHITSSSINFKKPNLNILNEFDREDVDFTKAETNINFLRNNLNLNYKFNHEVIELIDNNNNKINQSKLVGKINLDPFFFNLDLILSGIRIETVLNNLFLNLHKTNKSSNFNFNGNLKITLNEINNRLFENLIINVNFLDEKISLNNSSLNLKKIGKINFSDPAIFQKNQKLYVKSKIKFDVEDQQELYKRFLVPRQNRIDLNKVYFEVEYNVDDGNFFLSSINFTKSEKSETIFHEVNNIQQLNTLVTKEFKKINLD
tara:strand:- start:1408 stop:2832 length:1425 start_codon:yes stop_codon:yes gene_type:complete